jgi:maleate isomerase
MNGKSVYGSRGRIGLIVPANNSVIEPEFWSALPPGVAAYATRVRADGDLTPAVVRAMEARLDDAISAIEATRVDIIAYCDMVTTFIMEPGWNELAVDRIARETRLPTMTAWTALRDALAHIGARSVAIGTPYPSAIHAHVPAFFSGCGFTVMSHATLDISAMQEVPTVSRNRLEALIHTMDVRDCEALVLLATDLATFGWLDDLENDLGIPILSSNQALLWRALKSLGVNSTRPLGRLLRT